MSLTDADDWRRDYEHVRDQIIDRLNPPDSDIGESVIMVNAVNAIADYVQSQPCRCTSEAIDHQEFACGRCQVLGRLGDVEVDR